LAVPTHTISEAGRPQNNADSPRTKRLSDRNNSACAAGSSMPGGFEADDGVMEEVEG